MYDKLCQERQKVRGDVLSIKKRVLHLITSCHICPIKMLAKLFLWESADILYKLHVSAPIY